MMNAQTAQAEYFNRPKDERFPSIAALVENATQAKQRSAEVVRNAKELRAVPSADGSRIELQSARGGSAKLTHWSFGQLARSIGAPAGYLRELPAQLLADNVNHGLTHTPPGSDFKLLMTAADPAAADQTPTIRAATTESYSRVWDADLYGSIARTFAHDPAWQLPPTWGGEPAGANRGDRDSFLIMVNGGSIVTDPSARSGAGHDPNAGQMFRGFMIRNSEVGAASIVILEMMFRWICGNHMIGGFKTANVFRKRHVGTELDYKTIREIARMARSLTERSAAQDEAIIRTLITKELATTKEGVIDNLRAIGYSKDDAETAYQTAIEQEPNLSPRSYWGIAQGTTRMSQASGYQDERFLLDQLAAKVLQRGAALVAA